MRPFKNCLCPQSGQHWLRVYYRYYAQLLTKPTLSAWPNKLITVSIMPTLLSLPAMLTNQRWKPVGSTGTGQVDRQVGLPVGSRFFDGPVKPVEKPVKLSFLTTKKHLSTNRNILMYFIINKTFYKVSVLTNYTFRKHLLNGFKL